MIILVISLDFPPQPGGIAVFLHNLCTQLSRLEHHVDVLAPARVGCAEADARQRYRVYRYVSPRRPSSIVPIRRTLALYRQHRYDVIFMGLFFTTSALGALILRRLWDVPYVILSHGNDLTQTISNRVDELAARFLLHNATLMLGNSRFTVERIRQAGYKGPVEVLNPGVDPARFHPEVDTTRVRQQYNLDGRRVLLTTARLVAKKNVDGVLRALPKVIEQVPDVLYLVAGDGEERGRLEALRDELGLRSCVRFLGHIENSQLPALYCASDLFVMSSYEVKGSGDIETFGISFVEANACGKPVIGGWSGGTVDAVIDGETGLLVDPHDVDGIAEAIVRLLTDCELAHRLGENGRRRVERELNWEKVGGRLELALVRALR